MFQLRGKLPTTCWEGIKEFSCIRLKIISSPLHPIVFQKHQNLKSSHSKSEEKQCISLPQLLTAKQSTKNHVSSLHVCLHLKKGIAQSSSARTDSRDFYLKHNQRLETHR